MTFILGGKVWYPKPSLAELSLYSEGYRLGFSCTTGRRGFHDQLVSTVLNRSIGCVQIIPGEIAQPGVICSIVDQGGNDLAALRDRNCSVRVH